MEIKNIKNGIDYFNKSVFAGMMIGMGGVIYLRCPNQLLGSFMFSIGLMAIVIFQGNLFTGKVGLAKLIDTWSMIICLLGNYIGTLLIAKAVQHTKIYSTIQENLSGIVDGKLQSTYLSLLLLGIMCGMLMHIAVSSYKKHKNIIGVIMIFLCVSTFIMSGFEHCIADMFYFNLASSTYNMNLLIKLCVIILGNSIGAKIVEFYIKENN